MGTLKIYRIIVALIVCAFGVQGCETIGELFNLQQPVIPVVSPTPSPTPTQIIASAGALPCTPLNPNPEKIVICEFDAEFVKPNTYYTVDAINLGGGPLTFDWLNTNKCGIFTQQGDKATWNHPDSALPGACPPELIHPGHIEVLVDESVLCDYSFGSEPGKPAVCRTLTMGPSLTPTPILSTNGGISDSIMQGFLTQLAAALRTNDAVYLFNHLDPAIINLYGVQTCQMHFQNRSPDPSYNIEFISMTGPSSWVYAPSGQPQIPLDNIYTVNAKLTVKGQTDSNALLHIGLANNVLYWLTECK